MIVADVLLKWRQESDQDWSAKSSCSWGTGGGRGGGGCVSGGGGSGGGCGGGGDGRGQKRKELTDEQYAHACRQDCRLGTGVGSLGVVLDRREWLWIVRNGVTVLRPASSQEARWARNLLQRTGTELLESRTSTSTAGSTRPGSCQTCGHSRPWPGGPTQSDLHRCRLCYRWVCSWCRRNDVDQCVKCPNDQSGPSTRRAPTTAKAQRAMAMALSGELDRRADDATRRAGTPPLAHCHARLG